jgi:hypothetical protein
MTQWDAVRAAVKLYATPPSLRMVRAAPLPPGMTVLLTIASGDTDALRQAARSLDRPEQSISDAVQFYVEEVMFAPGADAHRMLGCSAGATMDELKAHRTLLLLWLHPDRAGTTGAQAKSAGMSRRVIDAWRVVSRDTGQDLGTPQDIERPASEHRRRRQVAVKRRGLWSRMKSALGAR